MARNTKDKNTIEKTGITFLYDNGEEKIIQFEDIPEMEKKLVDEHFKNFVEVKSFEDVAKSPKWSKPHIGLHEDGYYTTFYKETNVNFKRFIQAKLTKEELTKFSKDYKADLLTCNAFLRNIAIDGEKVSVSKVKETLNTINNEILHITLTLTNDNDEEYTLTCTNQMVRVMLVDKAKSTKDVSGFKTIKVVDLFEVILRGLSMKYNVSKE